MLRIEVQSLGQTRLALDVFTSAITTIVEVLKEESNVPRQWLIIRCLPLGCHCGGRGGCAYEVGYIEGVSEALDEAGGGK
jgi:hypothetical protein